MLHTNLRGHPGDRYSLYDNLWIFTAGETASEGVSGQGLFIAPHTGWYLVTGCGAGGGGASGTGQIHAGGGGGATVYRAALWLQAGEVLRVTVGAAGARGGVLGGANGGDGGNTTLGSRLTLGGGDGGNYTTFVGGPAGVLSGDYALSRYALASTDGGNGVAHAAPGDGYGGEGGFGALRFDESGLPSILVRSENSTPGTAVLGANGGSGVYFGAGGGGGGGNGGTGYYGGYGAPGILIIEAA